MDNFFFFFLIRNITNPNKIFNKSGSKRIVPLCCEIQIYSINSLKQYKKKCRILDTFAHDKITNFNIISLFLSDIVVE